MPSRSHPLPIDSLERRRLPLLLRRAWYGLNQAFRRRITHAGATPDQFTVLRTLTEGPAAGFTQNELAQQMSSDPNTIASLLDRMGKARWLERKPHETDKRARRIRLQPAGKKKYQELRDAAVQLQASILGAIPPKEREQFLKQLDLVANACRDAAEESAPNPKTAPRSR